MDMPNLTNINGKGGAPKGPRPQMLMCYLCGREFGSKSLPIHIPQCQKKWEAAEMAKHPKDRRPMPKPPAPEVPIRAGLGGGGGASAGGAGATTDFSSVQELNDAAYEQFKSTLTECPYCGRKFNPESFKHHERACYASNPAKPAGTGLTSTSLSNNKKINAYSNVNAGGAAAGSSSSSSSGPRGAAAPATASAKSKLDHTNKGKGEEQFEMDDASTGGGGKATAGGFCQECGAPFANPSAKFCGGCGSKRVS